jgi:type IV secretory pathway TraG/TraD family ATPase VirD4
MLILLTLRIRGSHDSTLALLKEMNGLAVHLIGIVHQWLHEVDFYGPGGLAYSHDFLIVNIASVPVALWLLAWLTRRYAAVLCRKVGWLCVSCRANSAAIFLSPVRHGH